MCYNNSMKTEKSFIVCVKGLNFWCARPHDSLKYSVFEYKNGKFHWLKDTIKIFSENSYLIFEWIHIKDNLFYSEYQLSAEFHIKKTIVKELYNEFWNWKNDWYKSKTWSSNTENWLMPNPITLGKWSDIYNNNYDYELLNRLFDAGLKLHCQTISELDCFKSWTEMNENDIINLLVNNKVISLVK